MENSIDHNALLLQVMAHDLLAPLTAIKWQTEILSKITPESGKYQTYLENINNSAVLGITLTKHAHVAGKVLTNSYTKDVEHVFLSQVIRTAAKSLELQYERHGLLLDIELQDTEEKQDIDKALTGLFVWAIAKFFLTCTPTNSTITMRGVSGREQDDTNTYDFIVSVPDVPEREEYVKLFKTPHARDAYDQTYIFVKLIHTIAPLLNVVVDASTQANLLAIEASFIKGTA